MDINKERELFIGDRLNKNENEIKKVDQTEIEHETPHPDDLNVQGHKETTIGFKPNEE